MSILDKILGRDEPTASPATPYTPPSTPSNAPGRAASTTDEQAVSRYQYMLKTAPPEEIEKAHEEAFSKLTPEQRRLALQKLSESVPENERPQSDDPQSLARAATRAEIRQPGAMGGMFGGGGGMGLGGIIGGSLLGSIAGSFIGSSIANTFFSNPMHAQGYQNFAQQNGVDANDGVGEAATGDATAANEAYSEQVGNDAAPQTDPLGDPADATGTDLGGSGDLTSNLGGSDLGGFDGGGLDLGSDF